MIPSRKSRGPLISASCERQGLRLFLFGCIFCVIISAYWWNFEQRLAKIQPPDGSHSIMNQDHVLEKKELKYLYAWRSKFQKEWNIPLLLQISVPALELPPYATSTLYVGVGLSHAEAVIAVPPLVRKALGEGLRLEAEENLALCIKNSAAIAEYSSLTRLEGQEEQLKAVKPAAAQAVTSCLDGALHHIWDAL